MSENRLIYFVLLVVFSCSTVSNDKRLRGHWHCAKTGQCEFETIDINDSTLVTDKYIVGYYNEVMYLDRNKVAWDEDVEVELSNGKLIVEHSDTRTEYITSDLQKCILADRYLNCMIALSLPEVESAKSFDISRNFTTGDLIIGKLKLGLNDSNDNLARQYPDSVFIQVNDVFIGFKDIAEYMRDLRSATDDRENINLHVDKDVPEGVVGTIVKLINPGEYPSTIIHNVVMTKNGDIGLL